MRIQAVHKHYPPGQPRPATEALLAPHFGGTEPSRPSIYENSKPRSGMNPNYYKMWLLTPHSAAQSLSPLENYSPPVKQKPLG
jgi:hypothetical protein